MDKTFFFLINEQKIMTKQVNSYTDFGINSSSRITVHLTPYNGFMPFFGF